MSEVLKIEGGHKLKGRVKISSSKNAAVALIPAAILGENTVTINGVPDIEDIKVLVELLKLLNVDVEFENDCMKINASNSVNTILDTPLAGKLRASYYFMGALLGKYKHVRMQLPGGCDLGPRPIDLHIKGFEALGAKVTYDKGIYNIDATELIGTRIYLDIASVGATINIILAATKAVGRTIIENSAKEPEVIDVANLLNKMGARIRGAGTDTITIDGVEKLNGCVHEIIPDRIEAGTYIVFAALAGEEVLIENVIVQHLDSLIAKLEECGAIIDKYQDRVIVRGCKEILNPINVKTQTYPGFPTDLQQILTVMLTQANGMSKIKETIYVERFKHCGQLNRLGAKIDVESGTATIYGKTPLQGTRVEATDLRCSASLILAGLIADGVTEISNLHHLDRGYENIDGKLKDLGAIIWREER